MGFYLPFISNFRQMPPIRRSCSAFVHELVATQATPQHPGYPATALPRNEATPQKDPVLSAVDFRFVLPLQGIRACNTWSVIGLTMLSLMDGVIGYPLPP